MVTKQSKRNQGEAARRQRQRRHRLRWAGAAAVLAAALGSAVLLSGGGDDQASALAPDFELENDSGELVRLSDYRGQPVAVTFMHTY